MARSRTPPRKNKKNKKYEYNLCYITLFIGSIMIYYYTVIICQKYL